LTKKYNIVANMEPTEPTQQENDQAEFYRKEAETRRNAARSKFMSDRWKDPEWKKQTQAKMREKRSQDRMRAKMRKAQYGAAKKRAEETGVIPHWAPKTVRVLEPNGKWQTYDSVRKCAQHYGIKENHLRGIIQRGGDWQGMKFIKE
jgi:hypothetical protein